MLDAHDHMTWCNRMAADHFALDPQRDLQQRITNLVRYPSFVSYLQAGQFKEPLQLASSRGLGTLSVIVRPYGDGLRLVLTRTSPSASGRKACDAISWPMFRTKSARR